MPSKMRSDVGFVSGNRILIINKNTSAGTNILLNVSVYIKPSSEVFNLITHSEARKQDE